MPADLPTSEQRVTSAIDHLPPNEQASLHAAIHGAMHEISSLTDAEREQSARLREITHHASNPGQDLMFLFAENGGIHLLPGQSGKTWEGTMRQRFSPASGIWKTDGTRISRESGSMTEWYVNRADGLEHGFTLKTRPEDSTATGPAVLRMTLENLIASMDPSRTGDLIFIDPATDAPVLGYRDLKVWDAGGRRLAAEMRPTGDGFLIAVNDTSAIYPVTVDPLIVSLEQTVRGPLGEASTYFKASNTAEEDRFGFSIAISGDTVVVGAPKEDSESTGMNGDQSNNAASDSGAAYVFVRNAGVWSQQAYLKASNTRAGDAFGTSVAISGDTIVVGAPGEDSGATGINGSQADSSAPDAGAAYVFNRSGTTWSQQAYVKASNTGAWDAFGVSVAIAGDSMIIGAEGEDSSVTGVGGNGGNNAAADAGAAYVFFRSSGAWAHQAYLKASNTGAGDRFGCSVGISGANAVVGAKGEDSASNGFASNPNDNTMTDSGAEYAFRFSGTWSQQAFLKDSYPVAVHPLFGKKPELFGSGVAVSGNTIAVTAPGKFATEDSLNGGKFGAVYLFFRDGSNWIQQHYVPSTSLTRALGASVSMDGDAVVVGSVTTPFLADNDYRSAILLFRNATSWSVHTIGEFATEEFLMDCSVSVSGSTIMIADSLEPSNATGINGNPNNFGAYRSGAAFSHRLDSGGTDDHFGLSVDVDGDTAVVGALDHDYMLNPNAGKAWIFRRTGTAWNLEAGLVNSSPQAYDRFGVSVAISGDRAVVGADYDDEPNTLGAAKVDCGSATVFLREPGGVWKREVKFSSEAAAGDSFGRSVAIDANTTVVGAPYANSGSGRAYTYANGGWFAQALIPPTAQAGALFGFSVAVSGSRIIVGAPRTDLPGIVDAGKICYFKPGTFGFWEADGDNGPLQAAACAGFSVAIDGNIAVVGCSGPSGWAGNGNDANRTGRAFVVTHDGTSWSPSFQYLDSTGFAAGSWFGMSVDIDGGIIAVGAFGNGTLTGQARIFRQNGTSWTKDSDISAQTGESDNSYGVSLALSGDTLLVGGYGADSNWINAGMAWVYRVTDPDAVIPALTISQSGPNAVLAWQPAAGWTLYRSPSLLPQSWQPVTVATDGNHTYPLSTAPRMFFRLQKP